MADVVVVCCTTTLRGGPTNKHRSPQHILAWVTLNVHLLVFCSPLMLPSVGLWSSVTSHHIAHHITSRAIAHSSLSGRLRERRRSP